MYTIKGNNNILVHGSNCTVNIYNGSNTANNSNIIIHHNILASILHSCIRSEVCLQEIYEFSLGNPLPQELFSDLVFKKLIGHKSLFSYV